MARLRESASTLAASSRTRPVTTYFGPASLKLISAESSSTEQAEAVVDDGDDEATDDGVDDPALATEEAACRR